MLGIDLIKKTLQR